MSGKKTTKPTKPTKPTRSLDTLHVGEDEYPAIRNSFKTLSWRHTVVSWLRDTPCIWDQKNTHLYPQPQPQFRKRKWEQQGEHMQLPTKKLRAASKESGSALTDSIGVIDNILTSRDKHSEAQSEVQKRALQGCQIEIHTLTGRPFPTGYCHRH